MRHILILGATGMLGSAVTKKLVESQKYCVTATCRTEAWTTLGEVILDTSPLRHKMLFDPGDFMQDSEKLSMKGVPSPYAHYDYIVNCIGIIKPQIAKVGIERTVYINSLFPHVLARFCSEHHIGLIHITTDCVYSGVRGAYIETDVHDCDDVYGKSKSLGEPSNQAMVLRTSIIGPEIHNFSSLVSWVHSQSKRSIDGFTNHQWNGITTKTYGQIIETIIDRGLWTPGLFHVFSPEDVTKYNLVKMISDRYSLDIYVNPVDASVPVNRTLRTIHSMNECVQVPHLEQQIAEM